ASDGAYVYFPTPGIPAIRSYPSVKAKPIGGGDSIELPNPSIASGRVRDFGADASGVYWLYGDPNSAVLTELAHWDGHEMAIVASIPASAAELVVDGGAAFVIATTDPAGGTNQALYEVSLATGTLTLLRPLHGHLIGLGPRTLFFTDGMSIRS